MHGIGTDRRALEREALRNVIAQWNANRLDIFELSEPNEELEFHGVMRFYFQDSGQKVATKCIRVASDATVEDVIGTLIEKFRPDMRMLSVPSYALFELHEHCAERKMSPDEKPLLVQLNWHVDDREGRFLLRNIDDKTLNSVGLSDSNLSFRRKLSKREKKQLKKQEKLSRMKSEAANENDVAEKLYSELPETSFTRSISNPEAVMRRRRQQKLERKLQQFRSKDGGPDTGGTLKIYGEALCRDVPYKTLLLSIRDSAGMVVREMLDKYGQTKVDPMLWCLVQVTTTGTVAGGGGGAGDSAEYVLDDDECPLSILMNAPANSSIMFHVRRRPADCAPRKRKKKPGGLGGGGGGTGNGSGGNGGGGGGGGGSLVGGGSVTGTIGGGLGGGGGYGRTVDVTQPVLVELGPDGAVPHPSDAARTVRITGDVMEVGSSNGIALQLYGPHIQPRHCVITTSDNGVTSLTPCHTDAHTYVNGQRIHQTTPLSHGSLVKFGNSNTYRYLDPGQQEDRRHGGGGGGGGGGHGMGVDSASLYDRSPQTLSPSDGGNKENFETTFDLEGNVETISTASGPREDARSIGSASENRVPTNMGPGYNSSITRSGGQDPILPAVLEFPEEHQDQFLARVITHLDTTFPNPSTNTNPSASPPTFRLAPAYTLYLCARYRASTHYRPELTPTERAYRLTQLLQHSAQLLRHTVQDRSTETGAQAFWLANASELLHFLKSDRHVSAFSLQAQDTLADGVQLAFRNLVACLTEELNGVLITLLVAEDGTSPQQIINILGQAMQLLRRCRVNAALTIQFFSQLFHWLATRSLSAVIGNGATLCCRSFGQRLGGRLRVLQQWAESQGLELAAECHLAKVVQAAHLLASGKGTAEELANLSAACFKLNSVQLRALLTQYKVEPGEVVASPALLEQTARAAEHVADELARADGREVRLHDDPTLHLQLLLPDDGFSCDVVTGVPAGLVDFLQPLQGAGLCRLAAQPTSSGQWTVYMGGGGGVGTGRPSSGMSGGGGATGGQPELQVIRLHKAGGGMGLSIVAAKGAGQERLGIYIKSVVAGGAADKDGRLAAGDQLLTVDGQSLLGITQERAAEYLVRTGSVVTLSVAKGGAVYHGLATLLQQPSPTPQRGGRRMSERDLPSRVDTDHPHHPSHHPHSRIPSSKSVPALHHLSPTSTEPYHHHHHHPTQPPPSSSSHQPSQGQSSSAHDVFNPGYSRTSSSNSINNGVGSAVVVTTPGQSHVGVRSRSTVNLVSGGGGGGGGQLQQQQLQQQQMQQQQQQQDGGFYQNLSVYRNSGSEKALGDRTSIHRISQNSLHSNHLTNTTPGGANNPPLTNRPVSAYYTTPTSNTPLTHSTPVDNNPLLTGTPPTGRLPLHLSIPNLKTTGNVAANANHQSSPGQQHNQLQQVQQQQRALHGSYPNMTTVSQQQQQQQYMQQQQQQYGNSSAVYGSPPLPGDVGGESNGYGGPRRERDGERYAAGLLQEDLRYNTRQQQDEMVYRNGYNTTGGEMRVSKSEDMLRQQHHHHQPSTLHHPHHHNTQASQPDNAMLRYASSGNIVRTQESNKVELPQLRHQTGEGGGEQLQRGQAKLVEMGEEVRRRQQRTQQQDQNSIYVNKTETTTATAAAAAGMSNGGGYGGQLQYKNQQLTHNMQNLQLNHNQNQPQSPPPSNYPPQAASHIQYTKTPPTAAPKPPRTNNTNQKPLDGGEGGGGSSNNTVVAGAPELPPTSTHPLYYHQGAVGGTGGSKGMPRDPWLREEQERQAEVRREQARLWQEQQIHDLSGLQQRTTQQDEQLRVLRLEREFQRRALEAAENEDEDTEKDSPIHQHHHHNTPTTVGILKPPQTTANSTVPPNSSATMAAMNTINSSNSVHTTTMTTAGSGGVSDVSAPPPPERGSSYTVMSMRNSNNSHVTTTAVGNAAGVNGTKRVSFNDSGHGHSHSTSGATSGLVSASVTSVAEVLDRNDEAYVMHEDPDQFIRQAESMLASPSIDHPHNPFPGNSSLNTPTNNNNNNNSTLSNNSAIQATPGVIGAQEVYRDPRTRLLAEQQALQRPAAGGLVPEKLTFKEKMKMFAMETGETCTPRDKSKISRAQREIDNGAAAGGGGGGGQQQGGSGQNLVH